MFIDVYYLEYKWQEHGNMFFAIFLRKITHAVVNDSNVFCKEFLHEVGFSKKFFLCMNRLFTRSLDPKQ